MIRCFPWGGGVLTETSRKPGVEGEDVSSSEGSGESRRHQHVSDKAMVSKTTSLPVTVVPVNDAVATMAMVREEFSRKSLPIARSGIVV